MNHAVTSAVRRIPVPMEGHAPSCATTPNKSSTAHAPKDFFGKFCEKKSPTSCKQLQLEAKKPKSSTVYTLHDPESKFSTKPSVILPLKLDSFGLCSSPPA